MKQLSKYTFTVMIAAALLMIGIFAGSAAYERDSKITSDTHTRVELLADNTGYVDVIGGDAPVFKVIFSSDNDALDQELASDILTLAYKGGQMLDMLPDSFANETAYEILLGNTNRALSVELLAEMQKIQNRSEEELLIWAYAYRDGKLAYAASSNTAFGYAKDEFLSLFSENGTLSVPDDLYIIKTKTVREYEEELREKEQLERRESLDELIARNASYTQDMFGGAPKSMGKSPYDPPETYPTKGQHPRLFLTEGKLEQIREILNDPEYLRLSNGFWHEADAKYYMGHEIIDGYYDEITNNEIYRYNGAINSHIENKAMAYLLTGDEIYGYEAIIGMKEMILTLKYSRNVSPNGSEATGARHVTATVAKVYDWCYDLMTEDDKMQIIAGVSNLMLPYFTEWHFPPSNMSAVSGHGTGPLFFVCYMSLALAFYDEMPDWWEFIGGRYYEQYVPVVLEQLKGGWVSQGTACYGPGKFYDSFVPGYMLYISNGIFPYDMEDISTASRFIISHEMPSGKYFANGDGVKFNTGVDETYPWVLYMVSAITDDNTLVSYLKERSDGFSQCASDFSNEVTWAKLLTLLSYMPLDRLLDDAYSELEPIQAFDAPAAQITAREFWGEDAAATMMKIGTLTMANHDNYDHGTFHIYYKGLLTGASGTYPSYGSHEHIYYAQQTVSYNGLLVYNPELADDEPIYNGDGSIANPNRYFYSGSQKYRYEAGSIDTWQSGEYDMGDLISMTAAYNYDDGSSKYAYIAGDITTAYDLSTVDYVGRRMLTVFTGNDEFPMLFFVHDTVTSADGNEGFRKQFLLHTFGEPVIDKDAMTVTVSEGEGTLVMHSLFGWKTLEKIGGDGYAYWINGKEYYNPDGTLSGKNCLNPDSTSDRSHIIWGRAELTTDGNVHDDMTVAMYVKDADNENTLEILKYENEFIQMAEISGILVAFVKGDKLGYKALSFTTEGKGISEYYVAGVEAGTWQIFVDGRRVAQNYVYEGDGILNFYAPRGEIEIVPGPDVIGANGGKILYELGGGRLPEGAPVVYNNEIDTPLPLELTHPNGNTFLGWYTSSLFDEDSRITYIPAGTSGSVKLYAKWLLNYSKIEFGSGLFKNTGLASMTFTPDLSTAEAKKDASGRDYIEWIQHYDDPRIQITNGVHNFASMRSKTASYSLTLARPEGAELPDFDSLVLESNKSIDGKDRVWGTAKLFDFQKEANGDVIIKTGVKGAEIGRIKVGDPVTVKLTVDFENTLLIYYDENNDVTSLETFTVPAASGATTGIEWKDLIKNSFVYWRCLKNKDLVERSIMIYAIDITEGSRFARELSDGSIDYELNGGKLPADAPREYAKDSATALPSPVKKNATFVGWYTSPDFSPESKVVEIPATATGIYKVYAKWSNVFVDEDYSETKFRIDENAEAVLKTNGLSYVTRGKFGALFETDTDEGGRHFLRWVKGSSDPSFSVNSPGAISFADMDATSASYEISLSRDGDAPILATNEIILESNVTVEGNSGYGTLKLLTVGTDGDVKCALDSVSLGNISDGSILTVRMTVDFKEGKIIFYGEGGRLIHEKSFTAPEASGASSTLEWKSLIQRYMIYVRADNKNADPTAALRIYGIKISEGNAFEKPKGERDIEYLISGGKLPENAPLEYSPDAATPLPIPTKPNAIFDGWFTSPDFDEATRVTEIPLGTEGVFTVHAKWFNVLFNEDFSSLDIALNSDAAANPNYGGLNLTVKGKTDGSFTTEKDKDGISYLKWIKGKSDTGLSITNPGGYSFASMAADAASYEIRISRDGDAPILASTEIILESNIDINGNKAWGTLRLLNIYSDGTVASATDSVPIGSIADGSVLTVRMVIDFKNAALIFYDDLGSEIHNMPLTPPEKSGAKTMLEWQKLIEKYMIYWRANSSSVDPAAALRIYGIKISEGNAFATESELSNTAIKYNAAGGILPDGAPKEYSKESATPLPIPTKPNAIFDGWFTDDAHSPELLVTEVPVDAEGVFTVYAKWLTVFIDEDFSGEVYADSTATKPTLINNITYVSQGKTGTVFESDTDDEGRTFLRWIKGSSDPNFSILNASTGTVDKMKENAISYEISFSRDGDAPILPFMNFDLESSVKADGTAATGSLQLIKSYRDGEVRCALNNVTLGSIADGSIFTLRLVLDFEKGEFCIYGDDLSVTTSGTFAAPEKSSASSTLEWKGLINKYLLYVKANTASAVEASSAIRFYGIKIAEGNLFE